MEGVLIFKMKIPKIYINKRNKNGDIVLVEFPRGVKGRRMWDKLILKIKGRIKV